MTERTLLDIVEEQEKIFADMAAGRLPQDDFERRVLNIQSRYDELVIRNPDNIDTLILYGKFLRRIDQNAMANTLFERADGLDPKLAVVKQQLGNYMAETGNHAEALAYYMMALDIAPEEAAYHFGMGELLATFRDKYQAQGVYTGEVLDRMILAAFAKAAELAPKDKDMAFRHGEAYYDLGTPRWQEALGVWDTIGARDDLTPFEQDVVRLHKARVMCELGRPGEALALLADDVPPFLRATRETLIKRATAQPAPQPDAIPAE
jgi:tetratricopeptide (TPR) repeat protein